MKAERWAVIESIYQRALELDPCERPSWFQQACAGDAVLRKEIESLLASADVDLSNHAVRPNMEKLWDHVVEHSNPDPSKDSSALPSNIGRYRILRVLGEGGMGVVYEAEQDHPRRIVALKVIKSGLSDPRLVRRFEQELLALGRLQHPGIAQIYEAGIAENGFGAQPYFAMEFIGGRPLLEYADTHQLSTRQRLDLIARVCEGVHHAHQRGIIHRDLKPGNIFVDETGQPKILDFGVARVTDSDARITHKTDVGQLIGTLAYMSPEQVLGDPRALDTRSDVYALGVVLYQLLAGNLPYKIDSRLPEAVRTIEEDEPRPLGAVSTRYRGDIETIVAKALEKDKTRRYASAADLAADIRRYLHDEPIMARPASTIYQLQKFARRHKALVIGVAAVFIVLIAGIIVSTREASRANREAATSRAISDFLQNDLLAQASAASQARPDNKPDPDLKVRTALDRAAARISGRFDEEPEIEAAIRDTIGQAYLDLGLYPDARTQFERALDLQRRVLGPKNPQTLKTLNRIGYSAFLIGKYPEAEALLGQTLQTQRRVLGAEHPDTLSCIDALANVYWRQSKYTEAEGLYNEALSIQRRLLGSEHPDTLKSMHDVAIVYFEQGKYPQAEALENKTLGIRQRVLGPEHPDTLSSMDNLASVYYAQGKYPQAEALEGQTLEIRRRVLGPEHPQTLMSMNNLANVYDSEGRYAAAESLDSSSLEITRRIFGPENSDTLMSMNNLANVYVAQGSYQRAEALYTETIQTQRLVLGPQHPDTLASTNDLAAAYAAQGKYREAEALFGPNLEIQRRVLGPEHSDFLGAISALASMYQREGKYDRAETYAGQALSGRRHALGSTDPDTMNSAADLALVYESQRQFAKAEPLARESVEFYRNQQPDDWQRFRAESLLGASLGGQKEYAEAERLLLEGYKGMMARKNRIAVPDWYHVYLARNWLAQLYRAWGKPAKAAQWPQNLQASNNASSTH
jgi:serine/threonine protein kinase